MHPSLQEVGPFFDKVEIPPDPDDCWLWVGARSGGGYGYLWNSSLKRVQRAHRIAYELFHGAIPAGRELDHRCNIPACVNPAHLMATTHRANILRSHAPHAENARKTHCIRGHLLNGDNVYQRRDRRGRMCRRCSLLRQRRRVARLRGRV